MQIRPPSQAPSACKVCDGLARPFGEVDFNRNCEERRGVVLPALGIPIEYLRCERCGLLFTEAFDDWSHADFQAHVYNADYAPVDPDYEAVRPAANAMLVTRLFGKSAAALDVLDYGGGNGALAGSLRAAGYRTADSYDAFVPPHDVRPARTYNLVTCFETIEHMTDPVGGAADIAGLISPDGLLLFSTLTQPADIAAIGMGWWYAGPRNGHVTLHTRSSLAHLWQRHGLKCASFNDNLHVAFAAVPDFARHIFPASVK